VAVTEVTWGKEEALVVGTQAQQAVGHHCSAPGSLTDARDDTEKVVDALVHRRGDDSHSWERVGHRVDTHLCHKQRQQEDLVLRNVMVLRPKGPVSADPGLPPTPRPPRPLTRSTRTAIMAAAPVDTVQSVRITWSSLMSLGSRR
ncbi:unnamed protein product, partial [Gulo gulo]